MLIGEAANNIPKAVHEAHPDILWRKIIGARNQLAHAYLSIDDYTIWTIASEAVPELLPVLRKLLETAEQNTDCG